jgi:hypothetical protein
VNCQRGRSACDGPGSGGPVTALTALRSPLGPHKCGPGRPPRSRGIVASAQQDARIRRGPQQAIKRKMPGKTKDAGPRLRRPGKHLCSKSAEHRGGRCAHWFLGRHPTNHAYLDRLTVPLRAECGGLGADHGEKRETRRHDITPGDLTSRAHYRSPCTQRFFGERWLPQKEVCGLRQVQAIF